MWAGLWGKDCEERENWSWAEAETWQSLNFWAIGAAADKRGTVAQNQVGMVELGLCCSWTPVQGHSPSSEGGEMEAIKQRSPETVWHPDERDRPMHWRTHGRPLPPRRCSLPLCHLIGCWDTLTPPVFLRALWLRQQETPPIPPITNIPPWLSARFCTKETIGGGQFCGIGIISFPHPASHGARASSPEGLLPITNTHAHDVIFKCNILPFKWHNFVQKELRILQVRLQVSFQNMYSYFDHLWSDDAHNHTQTYSISTFGLGMGRVKSDRFLGGTNLWGGPYCLNHFTANACILSALTKKIIFGIPCSNGCTANILIYLFRPKFTNQRTCSINFSFSKLRAIALKHSPTLPPSSIMHKWHLYDSRPTPSSTNGTRSLLITVLDHLSANQAKNRRF